MPKNRLLICGILLSILVVSVGFVPAERASAAAAYTLLDYTMCRDVDAIYAPIDKTYGFLTTYTQAVCWFKLRFNQVTVLTTYVKWYAGASLNSTKNISTSTTYSPSDQALYSLLNIAGAATGVWRAEAYANDTLIFTEYFTIGNYFVTATISGLPAANSTNVTIDGNLAGAIKGDKSKTFALADGTHTVAVDSAVLSGIAGKRYGCSANSWSVSSASSNTFTYSPQYYLTINTAYGTPKGLGWYDEGATAKFNVTTPALHGNGTRRVFTSWSGDLNSTALDATIVMSGAKSVTANWKTQYQLNVTSAYNAPNGTGWYDVGVNATFKVTSPADHGNGTRRVFVSWSGSSNANTTTSTLIMSGPKTVTATWKKQFYLTVNSAYSNTTGAGWYDVDANATFGVPSSRVNMPGILGTLGGKYVFTSWSGNSTATTIEATIKMDGPKTVTANWEADLTYPYVAIAIGIIAITVAVGVIVLRRKGVPTAESPMPPEYTPTPPTPTPPSSSHFI